MKTELTDEALEIGRVVHAALVKKGGVDLARAAEDGASGPDGTDVLDQVGAKRAFAGRGLTARFLMVMPPSNVGYRDRLRHATDAAEIAARYEAAIVRLAERCHGGRIELVLAGPPSDHAPVVVDLS